MQKKCERCGKVFYKFPTHSKKYWSKKKFCSTDCSNKEHFINKIPWNKGKEINRGKDNPNWKGGRRITKAGYVIILIEKERRYEYEHRFLIEKKIGRKLKRSEVIHHKNGIKNDNRIKNLELLKKSDHDRMETKKRWIKNPKSFNNYKLRDK